MEVDNSQPRASDNSATKNPARPSDSQGVIAGTSIDWFTNGETGIVASSSVSQEEKPPDPLKEACFTDEEDMDTAVLHPSRKPSGPPQKEKFIPTPVIPPT